MFALCGSIAYDDGNNFVSRSTYAFLNTATKRATNVKLGVPRYLRMSISALRSFTLVAQSLKTSHPSSLGLFY